MQRDYRKKRPWESVQPVQDVQQAQGAAGGAPQQRPLTGASEAMKTAAPQSMVPTQLPDAKTASGSFGPMAPDAGQQKLPETDMATGSYGMNRPQLNAELPDTMGVPGQTEGMRPDLHKGLYDRIIDQAEQQPGGAKANGLDPVMSSMRGGMPGKQPIGEEQIIEAELTLQKYKAGKARLEQRIIRNQQWYKLRNWEQIEDADGIRGAGDYKSNSAWLWNCCVGKHADFMDAYPEPVILPRAEDDEEESSRLSEIVPVIMQQNGFEQTYSDCQWQKVTEGTAVYSCMWDTQKLNGLGDISIEKVNTLNLFWEPGITNLQQSRHLFLCELMDNDLIEQMYPETQGQIKGSTLTLAKYMYDDSVDTSGKSVVVDWYYHRYDGGKRTLHYCKFVNHIVLYSTENEGMTDGLYDDGLYPFVMDAMYPVEGTPCGMGLIDVGRGCQQDIDMMNQAMVRNAVMASTPRYFIRKDGSVNEEEFADWSVPLVHVSGNLGADSIQQIQSNPLANLSVSFLQQKVEELKFVTGNVDVNNGSTPSGVTAASAIAALKEDAGRSSKDTNKSAYRAYSQLVTMVIERIRQFYDMPRQFRILGPRGEAKYQQYSNEGLQAQQQGTAFGQDMGMRLPVFDVEVRAQRENVYTKTAQNELAIQFYQLGFFNPQAADAALMALDMMDFRGKEDLIEKVQEQQTMQSMLVQYQQLALQIAQQNGDTDGIQAVQAIASGQGVVKGTEGTPSAQGVAEAGQQQAQQGFAPPQTQKLANIKQGNAQTGQTQDESAYPAGQQKKMQGVANRVANAKTPG